MELYSHIILNIDSFLIPYAKYNLHLVVPISWHLALVLDYFGGQTNSTRLAPPLLGYY